MNEALEKKLNEVFEAGKAEGRRLESERMTVQILNKLILELHISPDEAMRILQVPKAKRQSYKKIFAARLKQKPEKYQ